MKDTVELAPADLAFIKSGQDTQLACTCIDNSLKFYNLENDGSSYKFNVAMDSNQK